MFNVQITEEMNENDNSPKNPFLKAFKAYLRHKKQYRQNLTTLDEITPLIIRQICEIKGVKQVKITPIENIRIPAPLLKIELTEDLINQCLKSYNFFNCIFQKIGLNIPKLKVILNKPAFFVEFFERINPGSTKQQDSAQTKKQIQQNVDKQNLNITKQRKIST